jgi:ankyrin repeat protein
VINLLLENGARIDAQKNTGATPLLLAVMRNKLQAVELLLQHGASVKINGNDGTPLDVAFQKNAKDIFKLLVIAEKGAKKDR